MLKLDTDLSYDGRWYDFETGEVVEGPGPENACLKIRPQPFSASSITIRDGAMVISGEDQCQRFKDALEEMAHVVGADGKPLPCTDEVKQKIYDFRLGGIADFVLNKIWEFHRAKEREEKNS